MAEVAIRAFVLPQHLAAGFVRRAGQHELGVWERELAPRLQQIPGALAIVHAGDVEQHKARVCRRGRFESLRIGAERDLDDLARCDAVLDETPRDEVGRRYDDVRELALVPDARRRAESGRLPRAHRARFRPGDRQVVLVRGRHIQHSAESPALRLAQRVQRGALERVYLCHRSAAQRARRQPVEPCVAPLLNAVIPPEPDRIETGRGATHGHKRRRDRPHTASVDLRMPAFAYACDGGGALLGREPPPRSAALRAVVFPVHTGQKRIEDACLL